MFLSLKTSQTQSDLFFYFTLIKTVPYGDIQLLIRCHWSLMESCLIENHTKSSFLYR